MDVSVTGSWLQYLGTTMKLTFTAFYALKFRPLTTEMQWHCFGQRQNHCAGIVRPLVGEGIGVDCTGQVKEYIWHEYEWVYHIGLK
jgi:hypothetical protein